MIPRYSRPEMSALWTPEHRFATWLKVELAVLQAQEAMGIIPEGTHAKVAAKATFQVARIDELEAEVKHDIIAFVSCVAESVGEEGRFLHLGMTSSDLIDTAQSLMIQEAGVLVLNQLKTLRDVLWERAYEHRHTLCIGRSHGIHGEPITFGFKLVGWVDELNRHIERIQHALEENRVGMVSGAMGNFAHMPPSLEESVCESLGLKPIAASTQVISRDITASIYLALGHLASSIEKFVVEVRHLQRTEVLEAEEPFTKGQKGSSAMPHKRNPILSENMTGLARLIRSYTVPALENIALWHERDISHSSVERVTMPDMFILTDFMLHRLTGMMQNLVVYPENMMNNLQRFGGVVFSQRVLLKLVDAGLRREDAYKIVQGLAHQAWNNPTGDFKALIMQDTTLHGLLRQTLTSDEAVHALLEGCFTYDAYTKHIDTIFERVANQYPACCQAPMTLCGASL
ncbi:MAG: adenylosuccinate lyase [Vampirovibrionales bacterium]